MTLWLTFIGMTLSAKTPEPAYLMAVLAYDPWGRNGVEGASQGLWEGTLDRPSPVRAP